MLKKMLTIAFAAALSMGSAAASTIALEWTGSGSEGGSEFTRGWAFSTDKVIKITALGWFDFEGDGLVNSHQVGIWDASGNLLVSGLVSDGSSNPLQSGFRFTSALDGTPLLAAGTYVVAGLSTYDDPSWREVDPAFVTTGAGITYLEDRNSETPDFEFAVVHQGLDVGYFGANFTYAEVPEPSVASLSLLGLGLMGVAARRRRRRK